MILINTLKRHFIHNKPFLCGSPPPSTARLQARLRPASRHCSPQGAMDPAALTPGCSMAIPWGIPWGKQKDVENPWLS